MQILIIILCSILGLLILSEVLSLFIYHRFFFTSVVAFYIKHFRYSPFRQSYEECKRLISVPHKEYQLPENLKLSKEGLTIMALSGNTIVNGVRNSLADKPLPSVKDLVCGQDKKYQKKLA